MPRSALGGRQGPHSRVLRRRRRQADGCAPRTGGQIRSEPECADDPRVALAGSAANVRGAVPEGALKCFWRSCLIKGEMPPQDSPGDAALVRYLLGTVS